MYQPGRRETGGERATQRPFGGAPGGDPAAHPTPNAQRPNTQRSAIASPRVHLPRPPIWHRKVLERGSKTCYRTPRKVASSSTCAAGVTLPPNTQRPTPNAQRPNTQRSPIASPTVQLPRLSLCRRDVLERGFKTCYRSPRKVTSSSTSAAGATLPHPTPNTQRPTPNAQTPNAQKMNLHGSRRRLEACFSRAHRGPSQSITSADLVVAALEHPTPNTQRPNTQRPKPGLCSTPNAQHPTPNA